MPAHDRVHERLITPPPPCLHRMHRAEADREPVPGIDGADQHGQIDRLGFRELRADRLHRHRRARGFRRSASPPRSMPARRVRGRYRAATRARRSADTAAASVSPCLRASWVCMLMQKAQPLICEARVLTSSISDFSRPEAWIWVFQRAQRFDGVGGGLVEVHAGFHGRSPLGWLDDILVGAAGCQDGRASSASRAAISATISATPSR